ncbi:MAG: hypothetical protein Q4P72_06585 [Eubacteriales bacterium]|nr:hypothetical protein [Eubacteriales bacterium]
MRVNEVPILNERLSVSPNYQATQLSTYLYLAFMFCHFVGHRGYVLSAVLGILVLFFERENFYFRFAGAQCVLLSCILFVYQLVSSILEITLIWIPVMIILSVLVNVILLVLELVNLYKLQRRICWSMPLIGLYAQRLEKHIRPF